MNLKKCFRYGWGVICLFACTAYAQNVARARLELVPARTFFMQDAVAELRITLSSDGALSGKKLLVQVHAGTGKMVRSMEVIPLVFVNTVRLEGLPCGKYTARATLVSGDVDEASEATWFRVISAPTKKTRAEIRDGVLYADGKPFFMLSTGVGLDFKEREMPRKEQVRILDERLKELADHGFNLVCPSDAVFSEDYLKYPDIADIYAKTAGWGIRERVALMPKDRIGYSEFLALAKKHGLAVKGWITPVTRSLKLTQQQIEIWSDLVLKYRDEENILFWKTEDETDTWTEHNALLYRLFKEIDPARPVKLVVINAVAPNLDAADIHSTDPYPIGGADNIRSVADHCDRLKALTAPDKGKCFCLWLQMYGHKHEKKICPTPRQLRAMAFLAMNHRAKGLLYHNYTPAGERGKNDWELTNELWASMKTLNAQLTALSAPFLAGKNVSGVSADHGDVDVAAREYKGVLYVTAVNQSMRPIPLVRLTLPEGVWPQRAEQLFENRLTEIRGNTIEAAFNTNDVRVYTVRIDGEVRK